jgi:hypothetical protein
MSTKNCDFTAICFGELSQHEGYHRIVVAACKYCRRLVHDSAEGWSRHGGRMSQHIEACHLAPRPYRCDMPGCGFSYSTVQGLTGHVKKDHVEGAEVDAFAAALGLQLGSRVTPQMIVNALADPLFIGQGESSSCSGGLLNSIHNERRLDQRKGSNTPQEEGLRVTQPMIIDVVANPALTRPATVSNYLKELPNSVHNERRPMPRKGSKRPEERINRRPSDTQILNMDVTKHRSKAGEMYTLNDDVLLIRLVEHEKPVWKDVAKAFTGRSVQSLQNRYRRSLAIHRRGDTGMNSNPNTTLHKTWTCDTTNGRELPYTNDGGVLRAMYTSMEGSMYDDSSYGEGNGDESMIHKAGVINTVLRQRVVQESNELLSPLEPTRISQRFSLIEDGLILRGRADGLSWDSIAELLTGRNLVSCRNRYANGLKDRQE